MREANIYSKRVIRARRNDVEEVLSQASPAIAVSVKEGILMITQNRGRSAEKIFQIYNRVGAVMIGNIEDIQIIRKELVRESIILGDLTYSPKEVTAEVLSDVLAKTFKKTFYDFSSRPFEMEAIIVQVDEAPENDQIYSVSFDGRINKLPAAIIGKYGAKEENGKLLKAMEEIEKESTTLREYRSAVGILDGHSGPAGKFEIKYMKRSVLGPDEEFENILVAA